MINELVRRECERERKKESKEQQEVTLLGKQNQLSSQVTYRMETLSPHFGAFVRINVIGESLHVMPIMLELLRETAVIYDIFMAASVPFIGVNKKDFSDYLVGQ